jgi:hypothetical protein
MRWKENMYKHLTRECALTHSILIERFRIRRNEARSARYSFIIQTDAPLSQSSGFIVQSIIRTGNRKGPEWLLWVECSSDSPDVAGWFFRPTMADPATLTAAKSFFNGGSSSRPPDPSSSKSYAAMVEKKLSSATFTT